MINFEIKDLLDIYKLKTIIRYNQRQRIKDENVAEHSFFVTMLTLQICNKLQLSDEITYKAIVKALLHDMPEIELNDITYPVKIGLNLYPLLKEYENKYYEKNFAKYADLMKDEESLVSIIVDLADALSVFQYSINEESLGNTNFIDVKNDTIDRLNKTYSKLMEAINNGNTL